MSEYWPEGYKEDLNLKALMGAIRNAENIAMSSKLDDESDRFDREARPFKGWLATVPQAVRGGAFEMLRLDSTSQHLEGSVTVHLFAVAGDDIIDGLYSEVDSEVTRVSVRQRADISHWELRPAPDAMTQDPGGFDELIPTSLTLVIRFKDSHEIVLTDAPRKMRTRPDRDSVYRPDVIDVVEYLKS